MMGVTHVPVLIVGAGAGGLATSALLAQHGVRSLLVEKRDETFIYPKARNLSFRSLEILRELGLSKEVHAVADGVSGMFGKPALNSAEEWEAFDADAIFSPFDGLSPEPPGQYCPQSAFEPMLLAHIRSHRSEVRYGTELCSFEQDDSGVTATVRERDSGASETVRADYLVAADGVHSPIRDALGVTTSGYGALPIYVVFIYFRAPWRKFVPHLGDGDAVQVKNAEVDGIFLPVREDLGMFITTYFPDDGDTAAQFTAQRCRDVLTKAIGEPIDIDVIDVAPWQPYEQVADQFHSGRVVSRRRLGPHHAAVQGRRRQHGNSERAQPGLEAGRRRERDGRSCFARHLPHRAVPGGTLQRTAVAHWAGAGLLAVGRPQAAIAGGRGGADVRSAHRLPIPFRCRDFR